MNPFFMHAYITCCYNTIQQKYSSETTRRNKLYIDSKLKKNCSYSE